MDRDEKLEAFGEGPWLDEPDQIEWVDPDSGLPCTVRRNDMGNLLGYVDVWPNHPAWGETDYDSVPVQVHGGLTYAGSSSAGAGWWRFGFDAGHGWDIIPRSDKMLRDSGPLAGRPLRDYQDEQVTYKGVDFMKEQCAQLAAQLRAMALAKTLKDPP